MVRAKLMVLGLAVSVAGGAAFGATTGPVTQAAATREATTREAATKEGVGREAAPGAAAAQAAGKTLRNMYQRDITAARTPELKAALYKKLRAVAAQETHSVNKYALCMLMYDLGVEHGDHALCFEAADALGKQWQVDSLALKANASVPLSKGLRSPLEKKAFVAAIDPLIDEAIAGDKYDVAKRLSEQNLGLARSVGDDLLLAQVGATQKRVRESEAAFLTVKRLQPVLAKTPDDPEANEAVGKYKCFIKGEWADGLPMLEHAADETLKGLAAREKAKPEDGAGLVKLADDWMAAAERQKGTGREQILRHAKAFYTAGAPTLTGLSKVSAEKKVEEIDRMLRAIDCTPVYLSDLQEVEVVLGAGKLGKNGNTYVDKKISVRHAPVPKGLSMHPPSNGTAHVTYDLNKEYRTFQSGVAIDDAVARSKSPVIFAVVGDGKELWRSAPMQASGVTQTCRVSVRGVNTLQLVVRCEGYFEDAHAVWVDPLMLEEGE